MENNKVKQQTHINEEIASNSCFGRPFISFIINLTIFFKIGTNYNVSGITISILALSLNYKVRIMGSVERQIH